MDKILAFLSSPLKFIAIAERVMNWLSDFLVKLKKRDVEKAIEVKNETKDTSKLESTLSGDEP